MAAQQRPFGARDTVAVNALWLGIQFQDTAILAIVVPSLLLKLAPLTHTGVLALLATCVAAAWVFVPPVAGAISDRLAARGGDAVLMEDYCHSFEHTVEFQVVFLQHIYGPDIRILPILCGQFANSLYSGGAPEDDDGGRDRRRAPIAGGDSAAPARKRGPHRACGRA